MTGSTEWHGKVGDVWAAEWRRTDRSFAGLDPALDAVILRHAPAAGRFLDIGSGGGTTSLAIAAARPDATVTGIDLSPGLVAVAADRAAGRPNCLFIEGDAVARAPSHGPFDLLFSRHGVMFFDDPAAALGTLRTAAAPGAALVFSCFAERSANPWSDDLVAAVTDERPIAPRGYAPGPFGFADADLVRELLRRAGWGSVQATAHNYRYVAGAGADPVSDSADFFERIGPVARAIADRPAGERAALQERLRAALATHRIDDRVVFPARAWLWCAVNDR